MKSVILLFCLLLSSSAIAVDGPLAKVDSARIRAIALASITEKHPEVNSSKLAFDSLQYSLSASNAEVILVTYQLPSSTETKDQGEKTQNAMTKIETISVRMSNSGTLENVAKGSSIRMSTKPK